MKSFEINTRMKNLALAIALGGALFSCDNLNEDVTPIEETNTAQEIGVSLSSREVKGPVVVDMLKASSLSGTVQLSIAEAPQKGEVEILEKALLKYTPNADFKQGTDKLTYRICQGDDCNSGEISFSVADNDNACQVGAEFDEVTMQAGQDEVEIHVLQNDQICNDRVDASSLTIVAGPANGPAEMKNNVIYYSPAFGFSGTDELLYSVSGTDNPQEVTYATVRIKVSGNDNGNCTVAANDDTFTFTNAEFEDELSGTGTVYFDLGQEILKNDELCNGSITDFTIEVMDDAQFGEVSYAVLQAFGYKPSQGFNGTDSFTYKICDANGGNCVEAKVTLQVAN